MAKASDYYFVFNSDHESSEDNPSFFIVKKDFWDKYHHIDDNYDSEIGSLLPEDFYEIMESCYESTGSKDEATDALLTAGFSELKNSSL